MTSRIQTQRFTVTNTRPSNGIRPSGELWLNFPDFRLGMVDPTKAPVDLLPIRIYAPTATYAQGDFVVNAGQLLQAKTSLAPKVFASTDWNSFQSTVQNDARYLPFSGGTLTGALTLVGDPTTALAAATKQYVDAHTSGTGVFLPITGGALTGPLTLAGNATQSLQAVTLQQLNTFLPLAGGTLSGGLTATAFHANASMPKTAQGAYMMWNVVPGDGQTHFINNRGTGGGGFVFTDTNGTTDVTLLTMLQSGITASLPVTLPADPTTNLQAATKHYVDTHISGAFLPLSGGTLTGPLTLAADPTAPLQAATKEYVDGRVGGTGLISVPTIAALRSSTAAQLGTAPILVAGYHAAGDDGGGVYIIGNNAADNGGTIINDASGRSWYLALNGQPVSVTQFGALADNVNDSTAACQAADTWSRANGSYPVLFPPGIRVTQLVVYSGSNWRGSGRAPSTAGTTSVTWANIKQLSGHNNLDVLYGNNSQANMGQPGNAVSNYVDGYTLRDLTIDGNWNGGAGNNGGGGLWIFGCKPILENVFITNCATYGMYTGWTSTDPAGICPGFDAFTMEGYFSNVLIDTCGQHGWWNDGPHDSIVIGMRIVDASRSGNNQYDGIYFDGNGNGTLMFGCHVWTRHSSSGSATVRTRYGVNCQSPQFFNGCYFEGAQTAPMLVTGYTTANACEWLGANGGTTIQVQGGGNQLKGACSGPAVGAPACFGVVFSGGANSVANNTIDLDCDGQEAGAINFGSGVSGGGNYVHMRARLSGTDTYSGVAQISDDVRISVDNADGQGVFSNSYNKASLAEASAVFVGYGATAVPVALSVPQGTWRIWGQVGYINTSGGNVSLTNSQIGVGNTSGQPGTDGLQNVAAYGGSGADLSSGILEPAGHGVYTFYASTTLYLLGTAFFSGAGSVGVFGNLHAQRA